MAGVLLHDWVMLAYTLQATTHQQWLAVHLMLVQ